MGIWTNVLRWLDDEGINQESPPSPAASATVQEASLFTEEDAQWRSLTTNTRDQSPADRLTNLQNADDAWRTNPVAFRITEGTAELVLGRGLALVSEDEKTRTWLDEWWHHRQNRMPERQYSLFRELYLTGDLFLALFTNPFDGMTYVRTIPSIQIDDIETDPQDIERELRYHQAAHDKGQAGRWWTADEEMVHYTLYRLAGSKFGIAHIAPSLPWIRRYRDWLVDRVRVNKFKGAYLWDVMIRGADRKVILQKQQELATPPSPGSVIVHNESEEWKSINANIDAPEASADGKSIRRMFALGAGFPMHYLSEADDANRATAHEQDRPVALHIQRLQSAFGWALANLARRCAERSGKFPQGVGPIAAVYSESDTADTQQLATAAQAAATALEKAVAGGWIDRDEARALFYRVVGPLTDQPTPDRINAHGTGGK